MQGDCKPAASMRRGLTPRGNSMCPSVTIVTPSQARHWLDTPGSYFMKVIESGCEDVSAIERQAKCYVPLEMESVACHAEPPWGAPGLVVGQEGGGHSMVSSEGAGGKARQAGPGPAWAALNAPAGFGGRLSLLVWSWPGIDSGQGDSAFLGCGLGICFLAPERFAVSCLSLRLAGGRGAVSPQSSLTMSRCHTI